MVKSDLQVSTSTDKLLSESVLDYTTLRFPWLNDRDEVKYSITYKDEPFFRGRFASKHGRRDC
ncbi:NAD(P)H-binding protein [Lactiplantibacillus sp. DA1]|uniref:NAD(P)H-binding protein n=1 Tax=Lactiplantibacillus sp. DA1 TaxID=3079857 RepID=UPI00292A6313|nr:NAD(P)H-binding protein [Lactiplantibacillus sp. DA1]MDV0430696.1 NAD(P)H-binding protein [Lactiplantibacillus sp. DA1]